MKSQLCDLPDSEKTPLVLRKRYESRNRFGDITEKECVDMILDILKYRQTTFLFIDALDECDRADRNDLVKSLERLLCESQNLLKVFVSSRDDQDIVVFMDNYPNHEIRATDNQADIDLVVDQQVDQLINNKRLLPTQQIPQSLAEKIKRCLRDGAQGM